MAVNKTMPSSDEWRQSMAINLTMPSSDEEGGPLAVEGEKSIKHPVCVNFSIREYKL